MSLADALKALQENPDDLTQLPQLIEQVATLEGEVGSYQERIANLQQINKEYLGMIPVETNVANEEAEKDVEPEEPTFKDAQEQLINVLQNSGGY